MRSQVKEIEDELKHQVSDFQEVGMMISAFVFKSRRLHTMYWRDWSSDVCSSDLRRGVAGSLRRPLRGGGAGVLSPRRPGDAGGTHEAGSPRNDRRARDEQLTDTVSAPTAFQPTDGTGHPRGLPKLSGEAFRSEERRGGKEWRS